MGFKLSYKVFEKPETTMSVFRSMANAKYPNLEAAKKVDKLMKKLNDQYQKFSDERGKIQKACVFKKDDTGKMEMDKDGRPVLENGADIDEMVRTLLDTEVQMSCAPLGKKELDHIPASVEDLKVIKLIAEPTIFEDHQSVQI